MPHRSLGLAVIAAAVIAGGTGCNSTPPRPGFNTRDWVSAWVAMWNNYDLSQVDQLFVPDKSVTYYSSEFDGLIAGIEELRDHHRRFGFVEGGKSVESELWLEDLQTRIHDATAVVTGTWLFRRPGQSREQAQRGPVTFVYVLRLEGETSYSYRIAHAHFSNPPPGAQGGPPRAGAGGADEDAPKDPGG